MLDSYQFRTLWTQYHHHSPEDPFSLSEAIKIIVTYTLEESRDIVDRTDGSHGKTLHPAILDLLDSAIPALQELIRTACRRRWASKEFIIDPYDMNMDALRRGYSFTSMAAIWAGFVRRILIAEERFKQLCFPQNTLTMPCFPITSQAKAQNDSGSSPKTTSSTCDITSQSLPSPSSLSTSYPARPVKASVKDNEILETSDGKIEGKEKLEAAEETRRNDLQGIGSVAVRDSVCSTFSAEASSLTKMTPPTQLRTSEPLDTTPGVIDAVESPLGIAPAAVAGSLASAGFPIREESAFPPPIPVDADEDAVSGLLTCPTHPGVSPAPAQTEDAHASRNIQLVPGKDPPVQPNPSAPLDTAFDVTGAAKSPPELAPTTLARSLSSVGFSARMDAPLVPPILVAACQDAIPGLSTSPMQAGHPPAPLQAEDTPRSSNNSLLPGTVPPTPLRLSPQLAFGQDVPDVVKVPPSSLSPPGVSSPPIDRSFTDHNISSESETAVIPPLGLARRDGAEIALLREEVYAHSSTHSLSRHDTSSASALPPLAIRLNSARNMRSAVDTSLELPPAPGSPNTLGQTDFTATPPLAIAGCNAAPVHVHDTLFGSLAGPIHAGSFRTSASPGPEGAVTQREIQLSTDAIVRAVPPMPSLTNHCAAAFPGMTPPPSQNFHPTSYIFPSPAAGRCSTTLPASSSTTPPLSIPPDRAPPIVPRRSACLTFAHLIPDVVKSSPGLPATPIARSLMDSRRAAPADSSTARDVATPRHDGVEIMAVGRETAVKQSREHSLSPPPTRAPPPTSPMTHSPPEAGGECRRTLLDNVSPPGLILSTIFRSFVNSSPSTPVETTPDIAGSFVFTPRRPSTPINRSFVDFNTSSEGEFVSVPHLATTNRDGTEIGLPGGVCMPSSTCSLSNDDTPSIPALQGHSIRLDSAQDMPVDGKMSLDLSCTPSTPTSSRHTQLPSTPPRAVVTGDSTAVQAQDVVPGSPLPLLHPALPSRARDPPDHDKFAPSTPSHDRFVSSTITRSFATSRTQTRLASFPARTTAVLLCGTTITVANAALPWCSWGADVKHDAHGAPERLVRPRPNGRFASSLATLPSPLPSSTCTSVDHRPLKHTLSETPTEVDSPLNLLHSLAPSLLIPPSSNRTPIARSLEVSNASSIGEFGAIPTLAYASRDETKISLPGDRRSPSLKCSPSDNAGISLLETATPMQPSPSAPLDTAAATAGAVKSPPVFYSLLGFPSMPIIRSYVDFNPSSEGEFDAVPQFATPNGDEMEIGLRGVVCTPPSTRLATPIPRRSLAPPSSGAILLPPSLLSPDGCPSTAIARSCVDISTFGRANFGASSHLALASSNGTKIPWPEGDRSPFPTCSSWGNGTPSSSRSLALSTPSSSMAGLSPTDTAPSVQPRCSERPDSARNALDAVRTPLTLSPTPIDRSFVVFNISSQAELGAPPSCDSTELRLPGHIHTPSSTHSPVQHGTPLTSESSVDSNSPSFSADSTSWTKTGPHITFRHSTPVDSTQDVTGRVKSLSALVSPPGIAPAAVAVSLASAGVLARKEPPSTPPLLVAACEDGNAELLACPLHPGLFPAHPTGSTTLQAEDMSASDNVRLHLGKDPPLQSSPSTHTSDTPGTVKLASPLVSPPGLPPATIAWPLPFVGFSSRRDVSSVPPISVAACQDVVSGLLMCPTHPGRPPALVQAKDMSASTNIWLVPGKDPPVQPWPPTEPLKYPLRIPSRFKSHAALVSPTGIAPTAFAVSLVLTGVVAREESPLILPTVVAACQDAVSSLFECRMHHGHSPAPAKASVTRHPLPPPLEAPDLAQDVHRASQSPPGALFMPIAASFMVPNIPSHTEFTSMPPVAIAGCDAAAVYAHGAISGVLVDPIHIGFSAASTHAEDIFRSDNVPLGAGKAFPSRLRLAPRLVSGRDMLIIIESPLLSFSPPRLSSPPINRSCVDFNTSNEGEFGAMPQLATIFCDRTKIGVPGGVCTPSLTFSLSSYDTPSIPTLQHRSKCFDCAHDMANKGRTSLVLFCPIALNRKLVPTVVVIYHSAAVHAHNPAPVSLVAIHPPSLLSGARDPDRNKSATSTPSHPRFLTSMTPWIFTLPSAIVNLFPTDRNIAGGYESLSIDLPPTKTFNAVGWNDRS